MPPGSSWSGVLAGLGAGEPVGVGSGLDDGAVEGEPVDDGGVSGTVGGFVIRGANSVDTGVTTGVILFCVIGLAAAVVMRLRQARTLAARG
jgi:hypothetical protein